MSLSVDTQEKVIQFDRKENSLVMIKKELRKFREIKHLQLSISFSPFQIKQVYFCESLECKFHLIKNPRGLDGKQFDEHNYGTNSRLELV